MKELAAQWFDGKVSSGIPATITLDSSDRLVIKTAASVYSYHLSEIKILPRIGKLPMRIYFPDSSLCEASFDAELYERVTKNKANRTWSWIHKVENKLHYVLIALIVTIFLVWTTVEYGLPLFAKIASKYVSPDISLVMSEEALSVMDKSIFKPSQLSKQKKDELLQTFNNFIGDTASSYNIQFRKSDYIGANAFALPSGMIIFTDEMIELSQSDNELLGVLAHEIGHVVNRHSLQHLIQDSATATLMLLLTGDVGAASSMAAALPIILIQNRNSRLYETESDDYAITMLIDRGISPEHLANILNRMNQGADDDEFPEYLSTHPATKGRIERLRQAEVMNF